MTRKEMIAAFIESAIEAAKETFESDPGNFSPMLLVLTHTDGEEKPKMHLTVVPDFFLQNGTTKDMLVNIFIPAALKQFRDVICVSFVSDAWFTEMSKDQYDKIPGNKKGDIHNISQAANVKKSQALMFNFSTYHENIPIYCKYEVLAGKVVFTERISAPNLVVEKSRFAYLLKPDPENN